VRKARSVVQSVEGRLKFHDDRDILGVRVSVNDGNLLVRIRGLDRVWAFSRGLTIPLDRVEGARCVKKTDAPAAPLRWPGTYVPGLISAGSYRGRGKRSLWCVHRASRVLVIDLVDAPYDHVVVELPDPDTTSQEINDALS